MSSEFPIKNFAGLNLKDAADKVKDNEFTSLQNVWQPSKGVFARRFGSVIDQAAFPLASRMSGLWRHYGKNGDRVTVYHLDPDSTAFPDNTVDLTLADITSVNGTIFGGGAIVTLRVCYSWVGCGIEQTYNSKNRANFPAVGSFPMDASSNPAHQTITLASATNILRVTPPAFPTGVTSCNIFVARGTATQMTYMGSVTNGGHLDISSFIGPFGAASDPLSMAILGRTSTNGLLKPGVYWISGAWLCDSHVQEGASGNRFQSALQSGILPTAPTFGKGYPVNIFGSGTPSSTGGSLSLSTNYDFALTVSDPVLGEALVSNVGTVNTVASTAIDILMPFTIPDGFSTSATLNLYAGASGGTTYLVKGGINFSDPTKDVVVTVTAIPVATARPAVQAPSLTPPFGTYVTLTGSQNSIEIQAPLLASTNGAKSIYVFIGTQSPQLHAMTCVTTIDINKTFAIQSIPSTNAQSTPYLAQADTTFPPFWNGVNDAFIGGVNYSIGSKFLSRFGFMFSKSSTYGLRELYPSRTQVHQMLHYIQKSVFAGDTNLPDVGIPIDLHNFAPQPKTQNDLYSIPLLPTVYQQPFPWQQPAIDPVFCHHLGMSYFANGADIPWQTDGYTLCQISCVQGLSQTLLPPIANFIFEYQNSLVVSGGVLAGNQIYGSNASSPQNWATQGSGSLMRYVSIGDATGSGVTAFGIFTPATEATNNPNSFMIAFKKVGTWMVNTISDPTASVLTGLIGGQVPSSMTQISGRTGCTAYRTVVQTSVGTMFLGQDANVYIINRVAEPVKVGTKVQNLLSHLSENDAWMKLCTASYHQNHYKLSYPSAAAVLLNPIVNDSELWADLRTAEGDPISWVGPHLGRNIGSQIVLVGDNDDLSRLVADGARFRSYTADSKSALTDLDASGNPQSIAVSILSKIYRFGKEAHVKRYLGAILDMYIDTGYTNNLLFTGTADSFYHQVNRQLSSGGGVWDASQWDQANYADAMWQGFSFLFGGDNLAGRTFQWGVQTSDQAPFVLASATILLKPEKRRIIN